MLKNTGIEDNFKQRPLTQPRKKRAPLKYKHVLCPEGRAFILFVQFTVEQFLQGDKACMFTRKFKEAGLSPSAVHAYVRQRIQDYPAFYEEHSGRKLTDNIVKDRMHKGCLYTNGASGVGGKGAQGPEHYTRSDRLRPLVSKFEAWFRSGKKANLRKMAKLGEY